MIITVPFLHRELIGPTMFADLTTSPLSNVVWTPDGLLALTFDVDLTLEERIAVKIRCITYDAPGEATLKSAWSAYKANVTYLAIAVPTTAQVAAQVRALTNQMQGVFSYLAPITG